ncbi:PREDICTED: nuclear pore complex protein Nup50 [Bactrocera latifrons]|uniref:nuclear pore complex protein Nup50 n=1 Tax=Bactrocera latifrons TaxID=174628 RepID=UPI0008DD9858|nr:PREDICTED: nuclear pore complex protein Nup50 [Bactrocera latifrons]
MAGKRQATSNLNHENWDQEDEPEERGTFRKASEDELKNRVIKKARRKVVTGNSGEDATDDGAPKSVFSGFAGFGKPSNAAPSGSPFSFLSKASTSPADVSNAATTKPSFSFGTNIKTAPIIEKEGKTSAGNGNVVKENAKESKGKSTSYQCKIKSLNEAVTEWIKTHVEKNPLCILTPIFKDYDKYIKEIEDEEQNAEQLKASNDSASVKNTSSDAPTDTPTLGNFKFSAFSKPTTSTLSTSSTSALFSFSSTPASSAAAPSASSVSKPAETTKPSTFSFGIKHTENKNNVTDSQTSSPSKGFSFGLKTDNKPSTSMPFTFGKPATNGDSSEKKSPSFSFTPSSTPFSFGNIKPPADPTPSTSTDANLADDEEDQPPKVEFKQVVEEDAVYSKKCKVFVKKDGAFTDHGVGTLYLKPVKDSEKTQLLVRADTNLGNILVNLILSAGIPTQRMGKNNVMMVCFPTPDVEKATSMLLRVKTAEEADELLAELEKHKK